MNLKINNKIELRGYLYQMIPSLTSIINNITKVALPLLGLMTLYYIPAVRAGQQEYDDCVEQCDVMARSVEDYIPYGFSYPACVASCFFYLRS